MSQLLPLQKTVELVILGSHTAELQRIENEAMVSHKLSVYKLYGLFITQYTKRIDLLFLSSLFW